MLAYWDTVVKWCYFTKVIYSFYWQLLSVTAVPTLYTSVAVLSVSWPLPTLLCQCCVEITGIWLFIFKGTFIYFPAKFQMVKWQSLKAISYAARLVLPRRAFCHIIRLQELLCDGHNWGGGVVTFYLQELLCGWSELGVGEGGLLHLVVKNYCVIGQNWGGGVVEAGKQACSLIFSFNTNGQVWWPASWDVKKWWKSVKHNLEGRQRRWCAIWRKQWGLSFLAEDVRGTPTSCLKSCCQQSICSITKAVT